MVQRTVYSTVLTAILLLLIVYPVAAHSGEESTAAAATFGGGTILTVSLIAAVVLGVAFSALPAIKLRPIQIGIAALVVMTAVVHLMAGIDEFILILNGLGYPVILAALYWQPFKPFKDFKGSLYWLLIGYTTITIISFFVIHPWGIADGSLDWLGLITKMAEVVLLALLLVDWWQHQQNGAPTLYWAAKQRERWLWGVMIVLFILLAWGANQAGWLRLPTPPSLEADASLWLVFLTGLTAGGLSCLAVQGGLLATTVARREQFVLQEKSQSTGQATPILLFLAAKLVAYTLLGALLGLFGSWISLSTTMRGSLQIIIGLFMLGMALQMLNVHPIFRYLVIQPPKGLQRFVRKSSKADDAFTPLFLGALTVFIPCGVTQAMALLALGSGSATGGALIMFAFVLGTFPIFFILGLATARLSSAWEGTFMQVAAIAIFVMALYSMIAGSRLLGYQIGLNNPIEMARSETPLIDATPIPILSAEATGLTGATSDLPSIGSDGYQQITIAAMNEGYQPQLVKLRAGVPARINLVTNETYSCARAFVIPALGVEKILPATGTESIEFTPEEPGSIPFTCSMGMYTGVIEVVANETEIAEAPEVPAAAPMATQATEMDHKEMTDEAATPSQESQQVPARTKVAGRILLTASEQDRMQVFIMNSDGTGLEQLTDGPDEANDTLPSENIHPTISPDGAWVAYTSRHEGCPSFADSGRLGACLDINLMNLESREVKQLTSDPSRDYQPIFSPDGSQMAFISERDGDPDIWLINRDGSGLTQLLDRPEDQHLGGWSPDGQTILFVDHQHEQKKTTIWKMTLADGTLRKLTELGSINDGAVFSPDGERIAFYSNRTGDFNIFTMAADGSDIKQLTHDSQKAISPIYSPDGNWIIYGQLGGSMQQIPSTGGEPSTLTTSPEIQALPTGWAISVR